MISSDDRARLFSTEYNAGDRKDAKKWEAGRRTERGTDENGATNDDEVREAEKRHCRA